MKIAHIITRMCQGGAQENTWLTVSHQMKRGYAVDLITGPVGTNEKKLKYPLDGMSVFYVRELVREISPLKDAVAFAKIFRLLLRGKYDVVHTHTSKAGVIGRIAARLAGVPAIIHTPHGNVFYGYFSTLRTGLFTFIEKVLVRFTDTVVAITDNCMKEHLSRGIGRRSAYVIIPSGVEEEKYDRKLFDGSRLLRKELGIPGDAFLAGCASRLVPVKGLRYLIESMTFLDESFRLAIAGDGEEKDALEEYAREKNLEKRIFFLGMLADIRQFLSEIDVFVLPSVNEGMGRVLVEASLMGVPCVGTDVGGIPNVIVDGKTGFLVPCRSGKDIAEKLKYIRQNAEMRKMLGENAREYARKRFSAGTMCSSIENLYVKILERKGKWKN